MARTLFEMPPSGYRSVRGEIIRDLQIQLLRLDYDPGIADGIFGTKTRDAIYKWQTRNMSAPTGVVDVETWGKIMGGPAPSLAARSLQLTAAFEGHSFTLACGNFDGAWFTWGIIGFTLRHGQVDAIILEVNRTHPHYLDQAFGPLKAELLAVMQGSRDEKRDWADRISLGVQKVKIEPQWAEAFAKLGQIKEVQMIQLERVKGYYDRALQDMDHFELKTEAGYALCFDIAVQNGGIDFQEKAQIQSAFSHNPPLVERDSLMIIARVVAENSKPQYVQDVMSRKMTLAAGEGKVHGARYRVNTWGIGDMDAA
ncbi:MAG: peptidoglycan-binding protein [Desulfatibacillum sp.]|nr:peptidoglycan-binding protein [Desulfatibacillum sp.]